MTDTVAMNDRSGGLCSQFRLPTMGAQSVARFTAAGHGDALSSFLYLSPLVYLFQWHFRSVSHRRRQRRPALAFRQPYHQTKRLNVFLL